MQLLKRHDFAMIWFAGLVSYISGSMFIALPIWVFQQHGSATQVSIVALMSIIPSVALGSITGIFVDRWDRTRVMLIVTVIRIGWLLLLAVAVRADWFWLVLLVRLGTAAGMQFFKPAEQSLLPKIVDYDTELVRANSLNQLNNNLGGIVGTGLGGVLLIWIGMDGIALLMAILASISALLLSRIRYDDRRPATVETSGATTFSLARSTRNVAREWREGLTLFIRNPSIRILLLVISVASVSNVGVATLLPVFALETLDVNEAGVGLIFAAGSVGGMLGAVFLGIIPSTLPAHRIFQGSILVGAALDAIFYGYPLFTSGVLAISMAIDFIAGFPNAAANATAMTVFQTRVPERLLGRAIGSLGSVQALVMLIATPVAGVLADIFSAQSVLLGITLFMFASWLISLQLPDSEPEADPLGEAGG